MPDTSATTSPHGNDDATFRISRTVGGPLDAVWKAYTEQEPLMQWFGPSGFSMPFSKFDLRPGGEFHYCLRTPTGFEMWGKWIFLQIEAPHVLSMLVTFSDAKGGLTRHPMSAAWPLQTQSTTTFAAQGDDKTYITIAWQPHESDADEIAAFKAGHAAMAQGCNASFEQLDAYLAQLPRP
jgi:uncharacterized protein YndB with AHSA1/START domain